jgi:hypothetical protein
MAPKIIQWVKAHLTVVICGTLGLLSIVALVLGFILSDARSLLAADQQVYSSLQNAAGKAVNDRVIEQVRARQLEERRNVQRFLTEAAKTNPHTLLRANVFPEPKERMDPNFFVEACEKKRKELLALLKANDKPTDQDKLDYHKEMLRAKQKEMVESGQAPSSMYGTKGTALGGALSPVPGALMGDGIGLPGATAPLANMTPEERVKMDPAAGASLDRATRICCYASEQSLDPRTQITLKEKEIPPVELMWESQLSLWIQEDLIQALARLNNEAASQLPEEQRWVANLPIKHILYITIGGYLPKSAGGATGGAMGGAVLVGTPAVEVTSLAAPAGGAEGAFTKRTVTDKVDVVQLALGLVIDANSLIRVIDEIEKAGFYTPLLVSYETVEYDPSLHDYIYGSGPVVRARLEFEHCILRDKFIIVDKAAGDKKYAYLDLMPASIKEGTYVSDASRSSGGLLRTPTGVGPSPGYRPGGGQEGPPSRMRGSPRGRMES